MLLSVFIARGFQHQIRTKVIGFGSHIQVVPYFETAESGSEAMSVEQDFYKTAKDFKQIKSIQPVAYKPGVLQRTKKNTEGNREIQGVLFKGITKSYDKDFLKENLVEGKLVSFGPEASKEILISSKIASNLSVGIGDTLAGVLISKKENYSVSPEFRKFRVCGIYETGLEEFDNEYAFIDIAHIQKANGWGINAVPDINDTLKNDQLEISLDAVTSVNELQWSINRQPYPYHIVRLPLKEGTYTLVAGDRQHKIVADTVFIDIKNGDFESKEPNSYSKHYFTNGSNFTVSVMNTAGSGKYYAGNFEINLNKWEDLKETDQWLYKFTGPGFSTKTIIEQQPQIFNWLELVEMNVSIIVILMLVVAIINLISAILVLILERSKMIGLMKAFGASNATIGGIFFYFTSNILLRGLLIGNGIVLLVYVVQQTTGVLQLNPETYFVSTVPIQFDWKGFLFINALTTVVCLLAFFIPVLLVSRINPVKAIKIE